MVLEGLGARHARFLALLDGTRESGAVLGATAEHGLAGREAGELLNLLAAAGVLIDASADSRQLSALSQDDRDRLAPDLAAWSLVVAPSSACGRLSARRAAVVAVDDGRVGILVARLLREAGVGRVGDARIPEPDLVVLCPSGPVVRTPRASGLLAAGTAHLTVGCYETLGVVGPLVVPGRSPCLGCLDLHRSDRDPGWPVVAAQLATGPPSGTPAPGAVACDVGLASLAASLAALSALAVLDDPTGPHPLEGAQWLLRLPFGRPRRRAWGAHPRCGCGWPGSLRTDEAS
jgi:hypothetical protein